MEVLGIIICASLALVNCFIISYADFTYTGPYKEDFTPFLYLLGVIVSPLFFAGILGKTCPKVTKVDHSCQ